MMGSLLSLAMPLVVRRRPDSTWLHFFGRLRKMARPGRMPRLNVGQTSISIGFTLCCLNGMALVRHAEDLLPHRLRLADRSGTQRWPRWHFGGAARGWLIRGSRPAQRP